MKKIIAFIFLTQIIHNHSLFATHAMGADMTYKCLGPGTVPGTYNYLIKYTFYRDCSGIPISTFTGMLDITNTCGFPVQSVNLPIDAVNSPTQITPLCFSAISTCDGGNDLGIQEWIFMDTITLPGECDNWIFSHTESARNVSITTLQPNGSRNLYVYSKLNNSNGVCNNSPTFTNRPNPIAFTGQSFCYNHGTIEQDGDSLSFELITPKTGPNPEDTVLYDSGYSATQPLISFPPMTFNPSSGNFCISAQQPDVTVMAVLVNEYRNGILIGQVERDMQLTASSGNNDLPALTGFNFTPGFTAHACVNQMNCFSISSHDNNPGDSTFITWNNTIPNMTITTSGGIRDTAFLCWTPLPSDTTGNPYFFYVTVKDNHCSYNGIQVYAYSIIVDNSPSCIPLGIDKSIQDKTDFNVFPQPAMNELFFDFGDDFEFTQFRELSIETVLGEKIIQKLINNQHVKIDLGNLIFSGIYFARLLDGRNNTLSVKKIIISR